MDRSLALAHRSPSVLVWILGCLPLAGMILLALVGPYLLTVDPLHQDLDHAFEPPLGRFLLGSDNLGRSVAARLVEGARTSLGLATVGAVVSVVIGTLLGLIAAYRGAWIKAVVMRIADVLIACPTLLFVILVSGLLGGGLTSVLIAICLSHWPLFTKLVCAVAERELASEHVEASRLLGFSGGYIIRRQVMPSVSPYLLSLSALSLGGNVLNVSSVGFLGIGLHPPTPEWGSMIAETMKFVRTAPHMILAPSLAILICTLSSSLIADHVARRRLRLMSKVTQP